MIVQLLLFAVVLIPFLLLRPGTRACLRTEDELRRRTESRSQTRRRHLLETGVAAVFLVGVIGLLLVSLSGFAVDWI